MYWILDHGYWIQDIGSEDRPGSRALSRIRAPGYGTPPAAHAAGGAPFTGASTRAHVTASPRHRVYENGIRTTDWFPTPTVLGPLPIAFHTSTRTRPFDRFPWLPVADRRPLACV